MVLFLGAPAGEPEVRPRTTHAEIRRVIGRPAVSAAVGGAAAGRRLVCGDDRPPRGTPINLAASIAAGRAVYGPAAAVSPAELSKV